MVSSNLGARGSHLALVCLFFCLLHSSLSLQVTKTKTLIWRAQGWRKTSICTPGTMWHRWLVICVVGVCACVGAALLIAAGRVRVDLEHPGWVSVSQHHRGANSATQHN